MTKTPFFTIVTCTRNSSHSLSYNLNSVSNQTFTDYEHVFIDGESTDDTKEMIIKYQSLCPDKVKFFSYPPHGISDAMNKGIENSNGKYIIHLHSDDSLYDKDVLKNVHDFLVSHNLPDWIYGKINVIDDHRLTTGVFPTRKIFQNSNINLLKLFNYIPHQAVFISRKVFDKFGFFDINLKYAMDYDYWLKISPFTKFFFIDIVVSDYSVTPTSSSGNINNRSKYLQEKINIKNKYLRGLPAFISTSIERLLT